VAAPAAEPVCCAAAEEAPAAPVVEGSKTILISRVTCPNCRVAEQLLTKAGAPFEKHIAEEDLDLCRAYGVKGAPTLIIAKGENFRSYYSVPEIKKYLASL
jgi:ribonucleoside-triphosphate reductase